MAWGAFSNVETLALAFSSCKITATDTLKYWKVPFLQRNAQVMFLFEEDDAHEPHNCIDLLPWPPLLSDMNPIEN